MKLIHFIILAVAFIFGCQPKKTLPPKYFNHENDWQKYNLHSKVRSISTFAASVNSETNKTNTPIKINYKTFTPLGNISLIEKFDHFGKLKYTYKASYNSNNKPVFIMEQNVFLFQTTKKEIAYDSANNLIITKHLTNDSLTHTSFSTNDSEGKIISSIQTNGNDSIISQYSYVIDSLNRIIQEDVTIIDPNGKSTELNTYDYDKGGNLISTTKTRSNIGKRDTKYTYTDNRLSKITHYVNGFIDNEIQLNQYYMPVLIKRFLNSRLVRETKYIYQYDNYNNWTKRNKFVKDYSKYDKDFVLISKELRKIEYY